MSQQALSPKPSSNVPASVALVIGAAALAIARAQPRHDPRGGVAKHVAIRHPAAVRPWQHVLEPLAGYLCLGQQLLADPAGAAEAWNFGPPPQAHRHVREVVDAFAAAWPAVRYAADTDAHPHEAHSLHLDCRKAQERLRWRAVWDLPTTLRRSGSML